MSREFVSMPIPVERVDEVYELLARQPTKRTASAGAETDQSIIHRAYRQTSDTIRQFLDILAEHPGEYIGAGEMERQLGLTDPQFRGHLGGFTRLWYGPLKQPDNRYFFYASGSGEGGTMEYGVTHEVAEGLRRAKDAYTSKR